MQIMHINKNKYMNQQINMSHKEICVHPHLCVKVNLLSPPESRECHKHGEMCVRPQRRSKRHLQINKNENENKNRAQERKMQNNCIFMCARPLSQRIWNLVSGIRKGRKRAASCSHKSREACLLLILRIPIPFPARNAQMSDCS